MAIATATAIAIAASAASAAGTIYAANKSANANTEAAKTAADASTSAADKQLKAAEDALDFQKAEYARRQQQISPYVGMGQGALNSLGSYLGVSAVPQPPLNMPGMSTDQSTPLPAGATATQMSRAAASNPNGVPAVPVTSRTLADLGATEGSFGGDTMQPPAAYQSAIKQQTASSVAMRSPDGELGYVPADQVQRALAMGGTLVGGQS